MPAFVLKEFLDFYTKKRRFDVIYTQTVIFFREIKNAKYRDVVQAR